MGEKKFIFAYTVCLVVKTKEIREICLSGERQVFVVALDPTIAEKKAIDAVSKKFGVKKEDIYCNWIQYHGPQTEAGSGVFMR